MQSKTAEPLLQYKAEYCGKITLRQPVIIAWSFQVTGKQNLWLPPMDAVVKLNMPAIINLSEEINEVLTRQL